MTLNNIETAPKDGTSVILECDGRLLQASWNFGEWLEEKEWKKEELSRPSRELKPSRWMPLGT